MNWPKIYSLNTSPFFMLFTMGVIALIAFQTLDYNQPTQMLSQEVVGISNKIILASVLGYTIVNFGIPTTMAFILDHLIATNPDRKLNRKEESK